MSNRSYDRGSAFERYVASELMAMGFFAVRSAGSHTICDILATGTKPPYPLVLMIQCKTSKVDTLPNLKELLKRSEFDFQGKTNIQLLEEWPEAYHNHKKIIIWKGKGRMNMYAYRYIGDHIWKGSKIKSIEEYINQII